MTERPRDPDGEFFEESERKGEALVNVLKQVCSRNKALEKRQLWAQRDREDNGSATSLSLKSRNGKVTTVTKLPRGANVTENHVNQYEEERQRNTNRKEDVALNRFCDGKDHAWRPDSFFTDVCGGDEIPPWPVRPNEIFTNPELCAKVMARQMERRQRRKEEKKLKRAVKDADKKKGKKEKKSKKEKKKAKKDKKKAKKAKKKVEKKRKREESSDSTSSQEDQVELPSASGGEAGAGSSDRSSSSADAGAEVSGDQVDSSAE